MMVKTIVAVCCAALMLALASTSYATPLNEQLAQASSKALDDELWDTIRNTTNKGLLEAFIEEFPDSRHAPTARQRLATVKAARPGAPATAVTTPPVAPKPTTTTPPVATTTTPPPSTTRSGGTRETFAEPKQSKQGMTVHVDFCMQWGMGCGQSAADAFCQQNGFIRAMSFKRKVTGGPNWIQGESQLCHQADCAALSDVVCEARRAESMKMFEMIAQPRINGVAVSTCLAAGRDCGQKAADTYCQAAGWARATSFRESATSVRAVHLSDRTNCDGPQCRALTTLTCGR